MKPRSMSGVSTADSPAGVSAPDSDTPIVAPVSIIFVNSWHDSRRRAALNALKYRSISATTSALPSLSGGGATFGRLRSMRSYSTKPDEETTMVQLKGSKTPQNLKDAFAGESQAN